MGIGTLRLAIGPLAAWLIIGAWPAIAADSGDPWSSRSDAKRASASGRNNADNSKVGKSAGKSSAKLVPFPEDEPGGRQPSAAKTAQPAPRNSDFQPRFKPPAVRQAQHLEPVEAEEPATGPKLESAATADEARQPAESNESAEPRKLPEAKAPEAARSPGRELVDEAFAKSKAASSESDYTEVIDLCRRGMGTGLNKNYDDYARRLMGWAYNRRGESRAKSGRDKEALADFEAAVEASGSWRAIHNRGVSYAALGRIQDAMADLDRAIALNKEYPNAYFNRGELKYKQGDFAAAIADYNTALKLGPPDSAILNSRGHALYRLQRFGEALRDYGEAIKIDPENVAALINRGDTYSDLGQYGEAAKDYRAAMRIAPKLGRAYHSAAWFMATCPDEHYRNDQLAVKAAKKAIELDGEDYRNLATLAAAQASAGKFDEAQATQEKAIAKASKSDVVTAEKMMSLYHRDLAYRERPRSSFTPPEELDDSKVRQASGAEPRERSGKWPTRQASGTAPVRPQGRPSPRSRY
jgi:tetratricopeptide (TPR) repeat protein